MIKERLLQQQQQPQAFPEEIVSNCRKDTPSCNDDDQNDRIDTNNIVNKSLLLGLQQFIITILWPGLGLLSESYILFSIGTLHPIYSTIIQYICSYNTNNDVVNDDEAISVEQQQQQELLQSIFNALPYTICSSIIVGMIVLGILCDIYGRRIASIVTASCMLLGCIIATSIPLLFYIHIGRLQQQQQEQELAYSNKTYQTYIRIFVMAMNLFAFGVGGEYPVSASSATESSMKEQKKISTTMMTMTEQQQRQQQQQSLSSMNKNGKHIQLIFSMQGVGILLQVIVLTVLLLILQIRIKSNAYGYSNNDDENNNINNDKRTFQLIQGYILIWLIIYCIGTILLCIVTITRYIHLQESTIWLHASSLKSKPNASSLSSYIPQATTTQVEIVDANYNQCHEIQSLEQLDDSVITSTTKTITRTGDNWKKERDKVNTTPVFSDCNSDVSSLSIPSVAMLRQDDDEQHDRIIHEMNVNNDKEVQVYCINYSVDKNDNINTVNATGTAGIDQNHLYNMKIPSSSFQQQQCLTPLPTGMPVMAVHPKDIGDANKAEIDTPVLVEKYRWTVLLRILLYHTIPRYFYSIRLCSVSLVWFLWDITFYGNKLFQSSFLLSILSSSSSKSNINGNDDNTAINGISSIESMIQLSFAATINAIIAFCGYIVAAYIIDIPAIGRRNPQLYGLLVTGILFVGVGFLYDTLPTYMLIVLYFGTSFFGQCGPNATTFILPSEIFPTQVRTICHGIAAASGKFGALVATIFFHSVLSNQPQQQEQQSYNTIDLFLLSGYTSFLAAMITFWFIPETVCHDLSENDQYWEYVLKSYKTSVVNSIIHRNGGVHTCITSLKYHQNPKYLSLYEQRQQILYENAYDSNVDDVHQQYTTLHHDDSLIYA